MSGLRAAWLVATREMRERSRSSAFRISLAITVGVVVAMIVLPGLLLGTARTADVGLAGAAPSDLPGAVRAQAAAVGLTVQLHNYGSRSAGEEAVRRGEADVLVVDGRRLEWPRTADERLKAVVSGAIQVVAIRDRAAAAGISAEQLGTMMAPVPVTNIELSAVAGRTAADQTATVVMTGLLLVVMSTYGGLVLTGVVEEKASRVVEVLLARIPPRSLLGGKVLGIGLLGLVQVGVMALAALVAITAMGSLDVTAIRGAVLAWLVVWFVIGYALYAMLFGALGALASRPEDAQSSVAPTTMLMVASYLAAFFLIGQPDSVAARILSFFPTTAPMMMPDRLAMGSPAWWEPVAALVIALATIGVLVRVGGRLYATAILHGGPTLSLRDAWRAAQATAPSPGGATHRHVHNVWVFATRRMTMQQNDTRYRWTITALMTIGAAIGVAVGLLTADVIIGVIAGAGFIALTVQTVRLWAGPTGPTPSRS